MEKCYSIVDMEARSGGLWGLRLLDMAEVVVMVIIFIGNSVLKKDCLHFETKHASPAKPRWACCDVTRKSVYCKNIPVSHNRLLPILAAQTRGMGAVSSCSVYEGYSCHLISLLYSIFGQIKAGLKWFACAPLLFSPVFSLSADCFVARLKFDICSGIGLLFFWLWNYALNIHLQIGL